MASGLPKNPVYSGKSQSGAFAFFFGGEEGLKDARLGPLVHTTSVVADRQHDESPRSGGHFQAV